MLFKWSFWLNMIDIAEGHLNENFHLTKLVPFYYMVINFPLLFQPLKHGNRLFAVADNPIVFIF